jgi:hypothetical protein
MCAPELFAITNIMSGTVMERVKQFDLRVESASPEIRNLLVDALASSGLGVLSHVKSEELYPGAFDALLSRRLRLGWRLN